MIRTLLCVMLAMVLTGCDALAGFAGTDTSKEEPVFEPRFVVLESFKAFSEHERYSRTIKDVKTGKCYLWLRFGSGNGGVGITEEPCPGANLSERTEDLYEKIEALREKELY